MKTKAFLLFALLVLMMTSCLVRSLHPFYFASDVVYIPSLTGTWTDQEGGSWIISPLEVKRAGLHQTDYRIEHCDKDGARSLLNGTLFRLGDSLYLDFLPMMSKLDLSDLVSYHLTPTHSLAKVGLINNSVVTIKWFNEMWLSRLFEENRIRISHEKVTSDDDDDRIILTAPTRELQQFILKYGNDPKAFRDDPDDSDDKDEILSYTLTKQ